MKKLLLVLVMVLWVGAWAQEGSVQEFRQNFANGLRVAETPCPEELTPKFPEATCYLHGYDDFFDFKDAVGPYTFNFGGPLEPWHVVCMTLGSETVETFRARYRLRNTSGPITLTYISETLLVLETGDVRASP